MTVNKLGGQTSKAFEKKIITGDDGIVKFTWTPESDDSFATITVSTIVASTYGFGMKLQHNITWFWNRDL